MSDELNTGISIEFLLRQIDQALAAKDIEAAEKLLADAKGGIQPDAPEHAQLQEKACNLNGLREERVKVLEDAIRRLLTQPPVACEDLEKEIDALQQIQPDHRSLDCWRGQLAQHRKTQREARRMEALQAELTRRWDEAADAAKNGLLGPPLIALYERAWDYAAAEAGDIEHPRAAALLQQAETRLMEVRLDQNDNPTKTQTGNFRELLDLYRSKDPASTVPVGLDYRKVTETLKPMTVIEAIKIIERQARDFAAEKAREYRDEAERQLEAHAPVPADARLRDALDLFGLDEEERNRLLNFQATRVKPALTARDRQTKTPRGRDPGGPAEGLGDFRGRSCR